EWSVTVQPTSVANRPVAGQPDIHLRPDLTVDRAGRPVLVLDAKWKSLDATPLVTDDLYQVLAYCTGLGVRRAALLYPGDRGRVWSYSLAHAPISLTLRTVRVNGTRAACRQSLERLGRWARRAAGVGETP